MTTQTTSTFIARAVRYAARALTLIWAGWWILFGLVSGISGGIGIPNTLLHTAVPGLIFLAIAIIAWRWEGVGRFMLIGIGLLVCAIYLVFVHLPPQMNTGMLLSMAMPPLAAGGLLILAEWLLSRPVE